MTFPDGGKTGSVVETPPGKDAPELTHRVLQQRIRQQEILAELGVKALQGATFDQLLADTVRQTAAGLQAEFCKVLEHVPGENQFIVRAGIGWDAGVVGKARVGADLASPAGFALRTNKPVISNHLENEERFRTPDLLMQHGIRRAMNVILQGDGRPFGVLEVDSQSEGQFSEHDLTFLQGAANILGMAIERERYERNLKAALARQQVLVKEMSHRIKNSLAIVAGMLRLQSRDVGNPELTHHLNEAAQRVVAIARAHERIHQGSKVELLDLGNYIEQVCKDLDDVVAHCSIHVDVPGNVEIATDRAIPLALIVNELMTNAAKYAYKDREGGSIWVDVTRDEDTLTLRVRDAGAGLPDGFDPHKAKSLGMRIIVAFVEQLEGELSVRSLDKGTEFVVTVPLGAKHVDP
jgi:two-component sensor histidine kinase